VGLCTKQCVRVPEWTILISLRGTLTKIVRNLICWNFTEIISKIHTITGNVFSQNSNGKYCIFLKCQWGQPLNPNNQHGFTPYISLCLVSWIILFLWGSSLGEGVFLHYLCLGLIFWPVFFNAELLSEQNIEIFWSQNYKEMYGAEFMLGWVDDVTDSSKDS